MATPYTSLEARKKLLLFDVACVRKFARHVLVITEDGTVAEHIRNESGALDVIAVVGPCVVHNECVEGIVLEIGLRKARPYAQTYGAGAERHRVKPRRRHGSLTPAQWKKLFPALERAIMEEVNVRMKGWSLASWQISKRRVKAPRIGNKPPVGEKLTRYNGICFSVDFRDTHMLATVLRSEFEKRQVSHSADLGVVEEYVRELLLGTQFADKKDLKRFIKDPQLPVARLMGLLETKRLLPHQWAMLRRRFAKTAFESRFDVLLEWETKMQGFGLPLIEAWDTLLDLPVPQFESDVLLWARPFKRPRVHGNADRMSKPKIQKHLSFMVIPAPESFVPQQVDHSFLERTKKRTGTGGSSHDPDVPF